MGIGDSVERISSKGSDTLGRSEREPGGFMELPLQSGKGGFLPTATLPGTEAGRRN